MNKLRMNNVNHLLILLLMLLFVLTLVSQGHAHFFGKEKMASFIFYNQERVTGDDPPVVLVAKPEGTTVNASSLIPFGAVYAFDTPFTERQDPNSKVLGEAQGLVVSAGRDKSLLVFILDFGFTSGRFAGSSFSVLSRNPIMEAEREIAIVGGRGKFRLARGFAYLRTVANTTSYGFIVEYKVTIFYYE
ncbi:dirigent protein 4-like [Dioscorea cayenensis subsp. rotundata]|uniref:Dirigent protein n=1 Tax=Dioscorea cayennensis subsp. rotundata TaxID=55577 RepID=A0AB40AUY1_DIOCR|nr:dirigent protein 4-like [Dioscorea cayenensis subsp. rotundata]